MIAADVVWLVESDPTRPYREGSVQGEAENQQSDFISTLLPSNQVISSLIQL